MVDHIRIKRVDDGKIVLGATLTLLVVGLPGKEIERFDLPIKGCCRGR